MNCHWDLVLYEWAIREPNLTLYLNTHMHRAVMDTEKINSRGVLINSAPRKRSSWKRPCLSMRPATACWRIARARIIAGDARPRANTARRWRRKLRTEKLIG